jgi:hypothetical protein
VNRLEIGVGGALVGAVLTFGAMSLFDSSPSADPLGQSHQAKKTMEGSAAVELVEESVEAAYDAFDVAARCPDRVPLVRMHVFRCQALVEDRLVPVGVRIISTLGFFEVIWVG